jgi:hypothetical protein
LMRYFAIGFSEVITRAAERESRSGRGRKSI